MPLIPLMPIVFSNVGVVGRGAMSGSESTMWEAPIWVLMAHTTPLKGSAARMVVGLRVARPLRGPASEIDAVSVIDGTLLLAGQVMVQVWLMLRAAFATTT